MNNKESFKEFVRKNPYLLTHVKKGDMTWQGFYEIYDLYGESEDAWKSYMIEQPTKEAIAGFSVAEAIKWLKNINLDSLQEGVNSLQRVVGVIEEIGKKDSTESTKEEYKPRPIYKHFED